MSEVVSADSTRRLQLKRDEYGSITRSRKRKLRELFAVATAGDGLPNSTSEHLDAPPTSEIETKFLDGCDILQGRKLNELSIPTRPRLRSDSSRQSRSNASVSLNENVPLPQSKQAAKDGYRAPSQALSATGRVIATSAQKFLGSSQRPKVDTIPESTLVEINSVASPESSQLVPGSDKPTRPDAQPSEHQHSPSQAQVPEKDGKFVQVAKPDAGTPSPSRTVTSNPQPHRPKPEPSSSAHSGQTGPALDDPVQHGSAPDDDELNQMDIDEPTTHAPEDDSGIPLVIKSHDAPRPVDALSSPSSTAQTATTPAVLDTSTNTSPDHDGVQYVDRAEVKVEEEKPEGAPSLAMDSQSAVDPNGLSGSTSKEVEAQLLRDSADAAGNAGTTEQSPKTAPLQQPGTPTQATVRQPSKTTISSVDSHAQSHPNLSKATATATKAPEVILDQTGEVSAAGANAAATAEQANGVLSQTSTFPHHIDRARTRVSTGTIRQRSVSEILSGESANGLAAPRASDSGAHSHIPITPTSQSPRPRARSLTEQSRFKEKARLSTVVFGKQPRKTSDAAKSLSRPKSTSLLPTDDYFMPLFVQGFSNGTKWMKPLEQILHHAHKTVSTPDSYTQILDNQACKVLRRVYSLQQQDKWSLRQPKRCPEPTRQASHWDVVLKEMKWMRTDFREERKWKTAVARNLAYACADWIGLSDYPDEQRNLQVNAVTPLHPPRPRWEGGELKWETDVQMSEADAHATENYSTPGLISSADADSPMENEDELHDTFLDTLPPSAIFALQDDEVVFGLNHSPNADRLLDELPLYGSPLKVPDPDLTAPKYDPDSHWRREALPLSKYVEGRIELIADEPPRKRSRYQYALEDEDDDETPFDLEPSTTSQLDPENPNAALFRPENKAIRDRLHAGHQFRPPNEHTMPFQTFYESRSPSQWTMSEDDELKALVREYSYNWSLISSMLSTKSMFASAAERRTPWECFERWVMLEGLPHDMQKTQYFKLWQTRIDSAQTAIRLQNQNALTQQAQQQQQQAGANGPVTPVARRRLSLPVKVERRRNQKHLTMIDAMRKLAKKREATIQKAQHTAALAATRKAQEQPQPRAGTIKTPKEYSLMRWERDQAMAERLAERVAQHQQQRAEAQRRVRAAADGSSNNANPQAQAAMQARVQQGQAAPAASAQNPQMPLNQTQMGAPHPLAGVSRANGPNQIAVNGQSRPRMPMPGTPNGNVAQNHIAGTLVPPMQMNGTGQVQIPVVNGQARMTIPAQPDMNLVIQAQRISEQQRQAVQMRQAQQQAHPAQQQQQGTATLQNSPPAMRAAIANGVNQKNYINNAQAIMASFNAAGNSGMSTPPASGLNMPAGQSGSPRPNATMPTQFPQTFVSQLQAIESQIRQTHPNTPQDVVRQMATQLLQNRHNNIAQSAMNAAAGGQGQTAIANGPHQYAQLLRAQQQAQAAAAAQAQHQRNSSGGSATPPVPTMPK